jgi:hypothetical protein
MAYFIFLKYLRSLEEFMKNPHRKIPPKSPFANFQSLAIFKNQILFRKEFSSHSAQRPSSQQAHLEFRPSRSPFFPFQPAVAPPLPTGPRPLGRPSSSHSPTGHLLPPPAPEPNAQGATTGRPRATPTVDPDALHQKKKTDASIPLHSPINQRHSPSSNTGNRHLQTGAIEAPSTPTIEGAQPPPPLLHPIKGHPPSVKTPTPPTLLLLALNAPSSSPFRAEALPPMRRLSTTSQAATTPSLNSPTRLSLPRPSVGALEHQSGRRPSSGELPSAAMVAGPRWTGPAWSTDSWTQSMGFSLEKQFLGIPMSGILHLGPSTFSISTRSP